MIGRAGAGGVPVEQSRGRLDGDVVDTGFASTHEAAVIELPLLVTVGAEPGAGVVVPLVAEANGNACVVVAPDLFNEAVRKKSSITAAAASGTSWKNMCPVPLNTCSVAFGRR